jgi:hypothetical protein
LVALGGPAEVVAVVGGPADDSRRSRQPRLHERQQLRSTAVGAGRSSPGSRGTSCCRSRASPCPARTSERIFAGTRGARSIYEMSRSSRRIKPVSERADQSTSLAGVAWHMAPMSSRRQRRSAGHSPASWCRTMMPPWAGWSRR